MTDINTSIETANLSYPGGKISLPIVDATEGNNSIALGKLLAQSSYTTYDPGFLNTAAAKSAITYIDGNNSILRYRGYPIEQLAEHSNFLEVSYLLIYGQLPTPEQLKDFTDKIRSHISLHENFKHFFDGFPSGAHPMAVLSSAINALSTYYPDSLDVHDPQQIEISTILLLAKLPTIAAYTYRKSIGKSFLSSNNDRSFVENFFWLNFGSATENYTINPEIVKALDLLFILHADHELNCSTSTVRLVGSSNANIYASIAGGVNALWGPLHGGANQAVLEMLERIIKQRLSIPEFVRKVKNKESGVRLMGFGHRVYRSYDPRAAIVKKTVDKVLKLLDVDDQLLDLAQELEQTALTDDYFIERKLYPNVDFYTGLIYRAMGFPASMFTVLFAIGRLPGWIAHWRELHQDQDTKIGRPRQVYVGSSLRDYPTT